MELAAFLAIAAIALTGIGSSAASREPGRSGTITGWGATWVAMYNGEARDCHENPECLAWLRSGCHSALAGRNPAVTASIENVAELADGRTLREFKWRAISYPGWGIGGGAVVQLWREDCTEIKSSTWRSARRDGGRLTSERDTTFKIPPGAEWMTVTTNDTANLQWTLG